MRVVGDVKCYHCGHVSGQIEGTRTDRLVLHKFKPSAGFQGPEPRPGESLRCNRCGGPVFLEDLQPALPSVEPVPLAAMRAAKKRGRSSGSKAA